MNVLDRSTVAGIAAILTLILGQLAKYGLNIEISDETIFQISMIIAVVFTAIGNILSRSNNVSDQQAGVRPEIPATTVKDSDNVD
jgi:hypothetical protein